MKATIEIHGELQADVAGANKQLIMDVVQEWLIENGLSQKAIDPTEEQKKRGIVHVWSDGSVRVTTDFKVK